MNLLTHRSELARVAPFVVRAGPSLHSGAPPHKFSPSVEATVGYFSVVEERRRINVESEVPWI